MLAAESPQLTRAASSGAISPPAAVRAQARGPAYSAMAAALRQRQEAMDRQRQQQGEAADGGAGEPAGSGAVRPSRLSQSNS